LSRNDKLPVVAFTLPPERGLVDRQPRLDDVDGKVQDPSLHQRMRQEAQGTRPKVARLTGRGKPRREPPRPHPQQSRRWKGRTRRPQLRSPRPGPHTAAAAAAVPAAAAAAVATARQRLQQLRPPRLHQLSCIISPKPQNSPNRESRPRSRPSRESSNSREGEAATLISTWARRRQPPAACRSGHRRPRLRRPRGRPPPALTRCATTTPTTAASR